ncbi:GNAT family N-acetyltransferase [Cochlodiniinecator piscidefendens]|uniref:GNAT family N-acetyltransferase n=1 Tax=Cochlodiniinecator piscidefendens TaxID=2715756 RepID=UPI0014080ACC|nr:GNAT family N-acyltransferase [Cochlodiniinecator piscidefendens]
MARDLPKLELRLATNEQDLLGAQRLRYQVFIEELGGDGALVDHENRFETDAFDPYYDHLILVDPTRSALNLDHVVGVYRFLRSENLPENGRFYCEDEYDLTALKASGRKLLELGRSCLHVDFRGGTAMYQIWNGLAEYVLQHEIEILFGVASFHGTDLNALREPLSYLYHSHLAPEDLRVRVVNDAYQSMNIIPPDALDRKNAMAQTPALIKAYLRLGGFVGDGAFVDHDFNTTDICLVMDTERMNQKRRHIYTEVRNT